MAPDDSKSAKQTYHPHKTDKLDLDLKTSQLPESSREDEPVILFNKGVAMSYSKEQKKLLDRLYSKSRDVGILW